MSRDYYEVARLLCDMHSPCRSDSVVLRKPKGYPSPLLFDSDSLSLEAEDCIHKDVLGVEYVANLRFLVRVNCSGNEDENKDNARRVIQDYARRVFIGEIAADLYNLEAKIRQMGVVGCDDAKRAQEQYEVEQMIKRMISKLVV